VNVDAMIKNLVMLKSPPSLVMGTITKNLLNHIPIPLIASVIYGWTLVICQL